MSSNGSASSSTNPLFEEQADYLLKRHSLPFEKLLKSFQRRYCFETSGSLNDALIKSARRILDRRPDADIKSWAEGVIKSAKKSRSSKLTTTPSKRSWEEQVSTSEQESEGQKDDLQPHMQLLRYRPKEQPDQHKIEQSAEPFRIDPNKFELQEYKFRGVDVGSLFLDFQRRSTRLVNRLEEKASLFNLHSFLAMNYIWDMEHNLPTLSEDMFAALTSQYTCASISLSKEEAALCWELDQELMQTRAIAGRAPTSAALDRIVFIYQSMQVKYG
ncbi:hypothetical protein EDD11_009853 [Mortierella claussenii]|nr:hypothetical protein EDD11_009853 [Mortierella claussenii]